MDFDGSTMERLRSDLIRRARMDRDGSSNGNVDIEAGNGQPHMQESRSNGSPFTRLFRRGQPTSITPQPQQGENESVKSQETNANRPGLASRRLGLPNFLRILGGNNNTSLTHDPRNATAACGYAFSRIGIETSTA
ncbi:hypothetical protein NM208_g13163 [Fusarium decemcellulare]|uniref:Uncharacterized protein n=1 Tax=Fusarium decemcellulare TaxID=57161 RepID=A0ACC1RNI6_9HYPO|nr:hypothetical protein NM208_g13163 [Fusarium decemcellulare]